MEVQGWAGSSFPWGAGVSVLAQYPVPDALFPSPYSFFCGEPPGFELEPLPVSNILTSTSSSFLQSDLGSCRTFCPRSIPELPPPPQTLQVPRPETYSSAQGYFSPPLRPSSSAPQVECLQRCLRTSGRAWAFFGPKKELSTSGKSLKFSELPFLICKMRIAAYNHCDRKAAEKVKGDGQGVSSAWHSTGHTAGSPKEPSRRFHWGCCRSDDSRWRLETMLLLSV